MFPEGQIYLNFPQPISSFGKHFLVFIRTLVGWLFIFLVLTIAIVAVGALIIYLYFSPDITSRESIMNHKDTGVVLLDRYEKPFFTFYDGKNKVFVPLSGIPQHTKDAVVAVEDKNFYSHPGFSVKSMLRAAFNNLLEGGLKYGGSTITQQLAKNAFLSPNKDFLRKYKELVVAREIEKNFPKDEILEMYLNSVYWGRWAFGIEQASQMYFGKSSRDLTLNESAFLAGILPAPSKYYLSSGGLAFAQKRQKLVLEKMLEQGYITASEKQKAEAEELHFKQTENDLNYTAPHFALYVKDQLVKMYGEEAVARSGLKVRTTIDLDWQKYAEEVVEQQVRLLALERVSNGAVVVINPQTGEIMAMVGSGDWQDAEFGKFNAALAPRQPGSGFKPIVYAAAFEDRALDTAQSFGITTLDDPSRFGLSLVLGAGEVSLLELTNAYSVFANSGARNDITSILRIEDKYGETLYTHKQGNPWQIIEPESAFLISSILSDNGSRKEDIWHHA
ncbi:MAG: transglycosylase domain-containing protein [Candidatus Blackburnbacteria bacterium]|nr:transglycosylase domain-containing protein [Candidatus Blackburnbacteria bacterium]